MKTGTKQSFQAIRVSVCDFRAYRMRSTRRDNINRNPGGTDHAHSMAATLEARITTGEPQGEAEEHPVRKTMTVQHLNET
jgi:hypothetical protein